MSGGSYNYLYSSWDLEMLFKRLPDLENMAQRLAGLGYARDVAMETESLLLTLRQADVAIMARVERLKDVWHDVEWWDSMDGGEDDVKAAIEKYRAIATETPSLPRRGRNNTGNHNECRPAMK